MDYNTVLTIITITVIIVLFIAMVLSGISSSLASSDTSPNGGCKTNTTHKYTMYSAILYAIAMILIIIVFSLYKYNAQ